MIFAFCDCGNSALYWDSYNNCLVCNSCKCTSNDSGVQQIPDDPSIECQGESLKKPCTDCGADYLMGQDNCHSCGRICGT